MDIKNSIAQQYTFFNSNKTKEIPFRIEQLRKLKKVLQVNERKLYDAIYEDFGKSEFDTYMSELALVYHEINIFIKNIKRWSTRQKVATGLVNFPAKSYRIPEPLGVTLVIGAWNYPYQLSLIPAITAIAAGNTVVLKPSELPVKTSQVLAQIINDNFSANFFLVIQGGIKETTELISHRFDKIFFTGSTTVGRIIYEAAAKHLTPVTLELGGKSPTFVLADADIKMTAKRLVWGKFLNSGQTCIAPDYILVDQTIEEKLLKALKKEIEFYHKKAEDVSDNYSRIINTKNFERLKNLIDPDTLYFGGRTNKENKFISPTILHTISVDHAIMKEEIFGPILPVLSFTNLEDAIKMVKENPKPLSCYIFSKNSTKINQLLKEISFGGGCINDCLMHLSNSKLPFGGVGFSGMGSYHGKAGFDTFSHHKSILHKPFWFEAPLKYPPYSALKFNLIKRLFE